MPVLPEPLKSELVKKALNRAYELLSDRKRWAAGTIARDRFGRGVSATDPNAEQWCAVGAISRAAYEVCLERTDDLGAVSVDGAIKQVHGVVELLVRPVVVELANGLRPDLERWKQNHGNQGLPHFNDNPIWGYPVIIAAFAKASGNQLADSVSEGIERARSLRDRALKGWETRRRKRDAMWAEWSAKYEARRAAEQSTQPTTPPMTFGGTLPTTDTSPTTTKKEVVI